MVMKILLSLLIPLGCAGALPGRQRIDPTRYGFAFAISCRNLVAIKTTPAGISSVSLDSKTKNWATLSDKIVDVGPAVAGDTVAVITDSFNTIYAFSKHTGKLLWKKEHRSNILASDGKYFYVLRTDYDGVAALNPASGETVWSLRIPHQKGRPVDFWQIDDAFLYTDMFVVDLSKKLVVHTWPEKSGVNSIVKGEAGDVFVGDLSGVITEYDESFKPLRTVHAGQGVIVTLAVVGRDILAASYEHRVSSTHGAIALIASDGQRKWQIAFSSDHQWLDQHPFVVSGNDAYVIEPGATKNRLRLTSRKLSTGEMNWTTGDGVFYGPPVICGNEVYVMEGDQVRRFDAHTGMSDSP